jgi:hypothetical protein
MIRRVYIDTSVVGGYFESEFEEATIPFFGMVCDKKIRLLASELLEAELLRAPQKVRDFWDSLPQEQIDYVELTDDVILLSDKYIEEKVVGKTSRADCQHIAFATLNHADVLVSWNFKHIVNLERIRGYNSINIREGYPAIEIRTPRELISYGNKEK